MSGVSVRGDRRRSTESQAFERGAAGLADLGDEPSEVGFLDEVEPTGTILGGIVPGVQCLADENSVRPVPSICELSHRQDFVDDARQFEPGLGSVDLRHEDLAVEVVELLIENADEEHVLHAGVLKMRDPPDHFPAMQAVGAAHIWLAGRPADEASMRAARIDGFIFAGADQVAMLESALRLAGASL